MYSYQKGITDRNSGGLNSVRRSAKATTPSPMSPTHFGLTKTEDPIRPSLHSAHHVIASRLGGMKSKGRRGLWPDRNDDGMASVVTACTTRADVGSSKEEVNKFTLGLVASLRAENYDH